MEALSLHPAWHSDFSVWDSNTALAPQHLNIHSTDHDVERMANELFAYDPTIYPNPPPAPPQHTCLTAHGGLCVLHAQHAAATCAATQLHRLLTTAKVASSSVILQVWHQDSPQEVRTSLVGLKVCRPQLLVLLRLQGRGSSASEFQFPAADDCKASDFCQTAQQMCADILARACSPCSSADAKASNRLQAEAFRFRAEVGSQAITLTIGTSLWGRVSLDGDHVASSASASRGPPTVQPQPLPFGLMPPQPTSRVTRRRQLSTSPADSASSSKQPGPEPKKARSSASSAEDRGVEQASIE